MSYTKNKKLSSENLPIIRAFVLGITGIICLVYAGLALFLYPIIGFLFAQGWVTLERRIFGDGTSTGAAYLLLFVWFDYQGRT